MNASIVNRFFLLRRGSAASARGLAPGRPGQALLNRPSAPGPRGEPFAFDAVLQAPAMGTAGFESLAPPLREGLDLAASQCLDAVQRVIVPGAAAIKLMIFSRKAPQLSSRAYGEHWFGHHAQLVLRQPDFMRFVRGYRQNHVLPESVRTATGAPPADRDRFDGVIEQWFDSIDDALQAYRTPGYQIHIRSDEPNFLAVGTSIGSFVDEFAVSIHASHPPT